MRSVKSYGDPVAMVPGIRTSVGGFTGAANYAVSDDGTLAYMPGATGDRSVLEVVWVNRGGEKSALPIEPRNFNQMRLSPDGTRVAVGRRQEIDNETSLDNPWNISFRGVGKTPILLRIYVKNLEFHVPKKRERVRGKICE